ncbi:MAG TPA: ROK family protein [Candidatus Saccharimonadales bacterium]
MEQKNYGGIEAGGTKFICAVGTSPQEITEHIQIATTTPSETLDQVIDFFKRQPRLEAVGIASFGPLGLNKDSSTYGYITTTPKEGWAQTNLVGMMSEAFDVPIVLETDVNAAALAEHRYGAGKGFKSLAYMTVGTGIGIGCVIDDQILSGGLTHTEMGHMQLPLRPGDTDSISACPYHNNCLEGLASGTALKLRSGVAAESLNDSRFWELEAYYLSLGVVNVITNIMPMKIVVGGSVMNHSGLLDAVRLQVPRILNGYLQIPEILEKIDGYILSPQLGSMSGVSGALALALNHK